MREPMDVEFLPSAGARALEPLGEHQVECQLLLLGNRADHAAGVPRREDIVRDVASDDAAGADHAPRSNHYPGENDRAAADPHIGADRDRSYHPAHNRPIWTGPVGV